LGRVEDQDRAHDTTWCLCHAMGPIWHSWLRRCPSSHWYLRLEQNTSIKRAWITIPEHGEPQKIDTKTEAATVKINWRGRGNAVSSHFQPLQQHLLRLHDEEGVVHL
jgi:hypothetical protein